MSYKEFRILKSNATTTVGRPQTRINLPLTFEQWFEIQIAHREAQFGEKYFRDQDFPEFIEIHVHGKKTVIKEVEVFRQIYREEYLRKGAKEIPSMAGVTA